MKEKKLIKKIAHKWMKMNEKIFLGGFRWSFFASSFVYIINLLNEYVIAFTLRVL